ncbi:MAG: hypothetical protein ACOYKE_12655 [Ferruginibacter sp.]
MHHTGKFAAWLIGSFAVYLMLVWFQLHYYPGHNYFILFHKVILTIAMIVTMKMSFSKSGFRIFTVLYLCLSAVYLLLQYMPFFKQVHESVLFYGQFMRSPIMIILFFFLDELFVDVNKNEKITSA